MSDLEQVMTHAGKPVMYFDDRQPDVIEVRCYLGHVLDSVPVSEWAVSPWRSRFRDPDYLVECSSS